MCCRISVLKGVPLHGCGHSKCCHCVLELSRGPGKSQAATGVTVSTSHAGGVTWTIVRTFFMFTLAIVGAAGPGAAQRAYHATWADGVSLGAAAILTILPEALKLPSGAPACAPCDPATLWRIDRQALGARSDAAGTASTLGAMSVLGFGGLALVWHRRPSDARGDAVAYADAVGWSAVAVQWLKVAIGRERPVLYTSGAVAAASDRANQRSFPSTHTPAPFPAPPPPPSTPPPAP